MVGTSLAGVVGVVAFVVVAEVEVVSRTQQDRLCYYPPHYFPQTPDESSPDLMSSSCWWT